MCLHADFDLLFVGLNTGVVASIDLLVSHAKMRAWARGCVGEGNVGVWMAPTFSIKFELSYGSSRYRDSSAFLTCFNIS